MVTLRTQGMVQQHFRAIQSAIRVMLIRGFTKEHGLPLDWDNKEAILSKVARLEATLENIKLALKFED